MEDYEEEAIVIIQQEILQEVYPDEGFQRKSYVFQNAFNMPEKMFKRHFRLTKDLTRYLITVIRPFMQEHTRTSALHVESKVFIALNYFATGSYQMPVGNNAAISASQASVSRSIGEIVDILNRAEILNQFIQFPRNVQDLNALRQGFFDKYGMPGVIGCVDCTHIAIVPPTRRDVAPEYVFVNRKHYHSINTQLICDVNMKILHINARYPGSSSDKFIWENSNVQPVLRELYNRGNEGYFLLGDSGYVLRPWLLIPLETAITEGETRYNIEQRRIRSLIERCIGLLKMRFRCLLKHRVLHYNPTTASKIINSCAVLHNMCIYANVELDVEEPQQELDFGMFGDEPAENDVYAPNHNPELQAGRRVQRRIVNIYETDTNKRNAEVVGMAYG